MKTLILNVPDTLDVDNRDIAMLVSTQLYEQLQRFNIIFQHQIYQET